MFKDQKKINQNSMLDIPRQLSRVRERIASAALKYGRNPEDIRLLAVSKTKPSSDILQAVEFGQLSFGENYVQEAVDKIREIDKTELDWHFIGPIQSNKTRLIAENFSWVHSVDRLKIAQRLNDQLPDPRPPLNICLQVNVSDEVTKSGVTLDQLEELVLSIQSLPRLHLRGLMAIPAKLDGLEAQRLAFKKVKTKLTELNASMSLEMDTLSMGMSNDLEAAIAEGATIVRVGSDIFGKRGNLV